MSTVTKIGAGIVPLLMLLGCASPPELASVSAVSAPENTLFRNVSLFDGVTMRAHQDVLVSGREVAAVSDTSELETSPDTTEVAGAGLTLLPGLIDSHTHLVSAGEKHPPAPDPIAIGEAFLYAGVTTVLVTAGFDEVLSYRNQLREGVALGPTVLWGGPGLTAPGGHPIPLLRVMLPWPLSWMITRSVPTAADGKEARERVGGIIAEYGPDFVKIIYDDLPPGSSHLSRDALRGANRSCQGQRRPADRPHHDTGRHDRGGRCRRGTPCPRSATRRLVRRRCPATRGGRCALCDHRPTAVG